MHVTLHADQRPKQKPQKRDSASSSTRIILIGERIWTDVEPGKHSLSDCAVSKKLIHLLRHGSLLRDKDGAIEFWRIKDYLQDHFLCCHHWSDEKWKISMAGGGEQKKRFWYFSDSSGTFCTSELFKVNQDAVLLILHYKTMFDVSSYFVHVFCKTRVFQVDRLKIFMVFVHGMYRQKEYCLSVATILSSWYQS